MRPPLILQTAAAQVTHVPGCIVGFSTLVTILMPASVSVFLLRSCANYPIYTQ